MCNAPLLLVQTARVALACVACETVRLEGELLAVCRTVTQCMSMFVD